MNPAGRVVAAAVVAISVQVLVFVAAFRLTDDESTPTVVGGAGPATTMPLPVFGAQEVTVASVTSRLPAEWFVVRNTASRRTWDLLPSDRPSADLVSSLLTALSETTVLFAIDADLKSTTGLRVDLQKGPTGADQAAILQAYRDLFAKPGYKSFTERDVTLGKAKGQRLDAVGSVPDGREQKVVVLVVPSVQGTLTISLFTFDVFGKRDLFEGVIGSLKIE